MEPFVTPDNKCSFFGLYYSLFVKELICTARFKLNGPSHSYSLGIIIIIKISKAAFVVMLRFLQEERAFSLFMDLDDPFFISWN